MTPVLVGHHKALGKTAPPSMADAISLMAAGLDLGSVEWGRAKGPSPLHRKPSLGLGQRRHVKPRSPKYLVHASNGATATGPSSEGSAYCSSPDGLQSSNPKLYTSDDKCKCKCMRARCGAQEASPPSTSCHKYTTSHNWGGGETCPSTQHDSIVR